MPLAAIFAVLGTLFIVVSVFANTPRVFRQARSDPNSPAGAPPMIWIGLISGVVLDIIAVFLFVHES